MLADEPASMLDASIRLEVLAIVRRLQAERGLAFLFVTHDLAARAPSPIGCWCCTVGASSRAAPRPRCCETPAHPYTAELLAALPRPGGP